MINLTDKQKCSGCHACYNSCPKKCITMREDEEGFLYPSINQDLCINCGLCEKVCSFLETEQKAEPIEAWAAKCIDEKLRFESSSGGIFSLLSYVILEDEGCVLGARFTSDFRSVIHASTNNSQDLKVFRTSKYVQSIIGNTYQTTKELLDAGKEVLFSGVPCQIAGLKKYLGKEYENLFCVDVICHGVPSPELWKRYLINIEKKYKETITDVNFRHKKYGWKDFGIYKTSDSTEIYVSKDTDPYMQMFLRNYSLRPSCYSCQAKLNGSDADITLGDFWGIKNVAPSMNDGKGTSAVVINTVKGQKLFNEILNSVETKKVSYEDIKKYNSPIYKPVVKPQGRDTFFSDMNELSFDELATKYCAPKQKSIKQKLAGTKLWRITRRIIRGGVLNDKFDYGILIRIKK